MSQILLYATGMFLAWVVLEALTRSKLMVSSNAALLLSLGVMLAVVRVVDWQINSPIINSRDGGYVKFYDYFWDNALVVLVSLVASIFLEIRKRRK